jgi:hypothetical protein
VATRPVTLTDILDGHAVLDVSCPGSDLSQRLGAGPDDQRAAGRLLSAPGFPDPLPGRFRCEPGRSLHGRRKVGQRAATARSRIVDIVAITQNAASAPYGMPWRNHTKRRCRGRGARVSAVGPLATLPDDADSVMTANRQARRSAPPVALSELVLVHRACRPAVVFHSARWQAARQVKSVPSSGPEVEMMIRASERVARAKALARTRGTGTVRRHAGTRP